MEFFNGYKGKKNISKKQIKRFKFNDNCKKVGE